MKSSPWLFVGILVIGAAALLYQTSTSPTPPATSQPVPATRPRLLIFCTDSCPPCRRFHKDAEKDAVLKRALDNFDVTAAGGADDRKYGVSQYPSFVVVSPKGTVRLKVGYTSADALARWLNEQRGQP